MTPFISEMASLSNYMGKTRKERSNQSLTNGDMADKVKHSVVCEIVSNILFREKLSF